MKKTMLIAFFVALLCFGGIFTYAQKTLSKKNSLDRISDEGNRIEPRVEGELLFLLAGLDEAEEGGVSRTDTLMLVHINFDEGDTHFISIPRDTRVYIEDIDGNDKINHAHAYGGMKSTMKAVKDFLGIDVDYYVCFDFNSVIEVVNAIGGVEVNVPVRIQTYYPHINLYPGIQTLNGEEALMFARFRKGYEDGDLGRVDAQQQLVVQTIKELLKPRNVTRIPQLLDIYYDSVNTNIRFSELSSLIPILKDFSADKIKRTFIPGEEKIIDSIYYYQYDWEGTQEIIDTYLSEYKTNNVALLEEKWGVIVEDYDLDEDYGEENYYQEDYYEENYYQEYNHYEEDSWETESVQDSWEDESVEDEWIDDHWEDEKIENSWDDELVEDFDE